MRKAFLTRTLHTGICARFFDSGWTGEGVNKIYKRGTEIWRGEYVMQCQYIRYYHAKI